VTPTGEESQPEQWKVTFLRQQGHLILAWKKISERLKGGKIQKTIAVSEKLYKFTREKRQEVSGLNRRVQQKRGSSILPAGHKDPIVSHALDWPSPLERKSGGGIGEQNRTLSNRHINVRECATAGA